VTCCGRDVNINAPIATISGSVLLSAGRNVNLSAALTVTNGDITLSAGLNINVDAAIALTYAATIPVESLGLTQGLVLITGNGGTGPGTAGGTLIFGAGAPPVALTDASVIVTYNPVSYATPTDYSADFSLSCECTLTEEMLVFPQATKVYNGTDAATFSGSFNTTATSGTPAGVTLVANSGATAAYDSSGVGTDIGITFSGYGLAGPDAAAYTLADNCCAASARTSGTITAAPIPMPTPSPAPSPIPPPGTSPTANRALPIIVPPPPPTFAPIPFAPELTVLYGGVRLPLPQVPTAVLAPPPPVVLPPKQDRF
jgi:hypothetical protein